MTDGAGKNKEVPDFMETEASGSWIGNLQKVQDGSDGEKNATQEHERQTRAHILVDGIEDQ